MLRNVIFITDYMLMQHQTGYAVITPLTTNTQTAASCVVMETVRANPLGGEGQKSGVLCVGVLV